MTDERLATKDDLERLELKLILKLGAMMVGFIIIAALIYLT